MKFIKPVRIIKSEGVSNPEILLKDFPDQIELCPTQFATFKNGGYVIFDFGKEYSGGIKLFTKDVSNPHNLHIRFGESVGEACSELGYKNSTNDHSPRDFNTVTSTLSGLTFGESGFRFARIDFTGEFWNLRNAVLCCTNDEREEVGYFKSDDELLNKIWETASYTLRLCLHNGLFWDGVKRDRLCWIGDSYAESRTAMMLYKDIKELRNSLRFTIDTNYPGDYYNGLATYNLWFILILCDKYVFDGDESTPKEFRNDVLKTLVSFDNMIDEDGTTHLPMNFIDWPSHYNGGDGDELIKKDDETVGVTYMTKFTCQKIIKLYENFNDKEIIDLSNKIIKKLSNSQLSVKKFKQIAALGTFCGDVENQDKILLKDGAKGLSTFMSYFILSAVAYYGKYDEAFEMMKDYYGGMLSVGSTTFWEDFDIEWLDNASRIDELPIEGKKDIHGDYGKFCYVGYRHSFCHGWSSGVIPYIVENVVGLKAINSKTYSLNPHLSTLNYVECKVPTPYGLIEITINKKDDKLFTDIKSPKEVKIIQ